MPTVISAPRVTLVSRPLFINPDHIGWKANNTIPPAQALAELAGRTCYMSFGAGEIDGHQTVGGRNGNAEYLHNILKQGHGSVIEHANFSFLIEGISRTLSHEFVRHRAGFAYSQLSQRYVDESQVAFVKPPAIAFHTIEYFEWEDACDRALASYGNILAGLKDIYSGKQLRKRAHEAARSVLPGCVETKMVVTGNCRAWRNWLDQRGAIAADSEIRALARTLIIFLQAEAPDIFGDYQRVSEQIGGHTFHGLQGEHRKV